jgi:hypothetical protein
LLLLKLTAMHDKTQQPTNITIISRWWWWR